MIRNTTSRALISFSLLIATISWSGLVMLRTTLNTDRSEDVAQTLVTSTAVQNFVADKIVAEATQAAPDIGILGDDVLNSVARDAVEDPQVQQVLVDQIAGFHKRLVDGEDPGAVAVDGSSLGQAGQSYLSDQNQVLANLLPSDLNIPLTFGTSGVSFIPTLKDVLSDFVPLGLLVSTIGLVAGFVVAKDRRWGARRVAMWAAGTALFWLTLGVGIPLIMGQLSGESTALVGALATALFSAMVWPGIFMGIIAAVLLAASMFIFGKPTSGNTDTKAKNEQPGPFSSWDDRPTPREDPLPYREPYIDERDAPRYRDPLPPRDDYRDRI